MAILPPALGHSAIQTAPAHKKEQATSVRWLGWTASPSTSPQTLGTKIDTSNVLIARLYNGKKLRKRSYGGTCLTPPARYNPASAGRNVVVHQWLDGGRHCGQGAVSARGRVRVHSPPPFPLRPRPAGPTPLPPITCPAVLLLLGQAGNKVLRIRGTGGLAALPAVGTTTAASEIGAG